MPEIIEGRVYFVQIIENLLFAKGSLLLRHDGKTANDPIIYHREYHVIIKGKESSDTITFFYNKREDSARIEMNYADFTDLRFLLRINNINEQRNPTPKATQCNPL